MLQLPGTPRVCSRIALPLPMKVPFLDLKAHHAPLRGHFKTAIAEVIDSGIFAGGPAVADFEEAFAAFCKCDYAVGLGSGTEAVWLALLACGVGPGDEVITVPSTFMATAEAITYCGAKPVFVDVDERTYTMDPAGIGQCPNESYESYCSGSSFWPNRRHGSDSKVRPPAWLGRDRGCCPGTRCRIQEATSRVDGRNWLLQFLSWEKPWRAW